MVFACANMYLFRDVAEHFTGLDPIIVSYTGIPDPPENTLIVTDDAEEMNLYHRGRASEFGEWARSVAATREVWQVFESVLKMQGSLPFRPYSNTGSLDPLSSMRGVNVIGPASSSSDFFHNKANQFEYFCNEVPYAPGASLTKHDDLLDMYYRLDKGNGIFVSGLSGSAGNQCLHAREEKDIQDYLDRHSEHEAFFVSSWLEGEKLSPNVGAIAVSLEETVVLGMNQQILPDNLGCRGSIYPLPVTPVQEKRIVELTEKVGRIMAAHGYLGYFGADFLVHEGEIYFVEVNARYNASTAELLHTLRLDTSVNRLTLPDMERLAIRRGTLKDITLPQATKGIHWYRLQFKPPFRKGRVVRSLSELQRESELFDTGGLGFFGFMPEGSTFDHHAILGKIVCVAESKKQLDALILEANSIALGAVQEE